MEEETVLGNSAELKSEKLDNHPLLELHSDDSEVKRVVKRLINWYWGYDEAEGSQEITDVLYELGLEVEPTDVHSRKIQEHFIVMNELKNSIKFYQEQSMKYLERIEGLEYIVYLQDPKNKLKIRDVSSIVNKYPYADAELRKEVERSNARESATLDALCDAQMKYDDLLDKYWKLKLKYEPETKSDDCQVQQRLCKST